MSEELKIILGKLEHMDSKIDRIDSRMENEVIRDIRIIAEGHIDLSRKFDEAVKGRWERELILTRLNHLENEVGEVKKPQWNSIK